MLGVSSKGNFKPQSSGQSTYRGSSSGGMRSQEQRRKGYPIVSAEDPRQCNLENLLLVLKRKPSVLPVANTIGVSVMVEQLSASIVGR